MSPRLSFLMSLALVAATVAPSAAGATPDDMPLSNPPYGAPASVQPMERTEALPSRTCESPQAKRAVRHQVKRHRVARTHRAHRAHRRVARMDVHVPPVCGPVEPTCAGEIVKVTTMQRGREVTFRQRVTSNPASTCAPPTPVVQTSAASSPACSVCGGSPMTPSVCP